MDTGELFRICGVALVCSVLLVMLKNTSGGMDSLLRVGGGIVVFALVVSCIGEQILLIKSVVDKVPDDSGTMEKSFSLMLKALGIALVSKLGSDICRDCGEGTLAGGIESAGRVAIISLCIPVVSELCELAVKILEMGE